MLENIVQKTVWWCSRSCQKIARLANFKRLANNNRTEKLYLSRTRVFSIPQWRRWDLKGWERSGVGPSLHEKVDFPHSNNAAGKNQLHMRIHLHLQPEDRSSMELIVRRAFTSLQLRTILEENHHPFLIVEHNPLLYERARDMAGRVAQLTLPSQLKFLMPMMSAALRYHAHLQTIHIAMCR